MKYGAVLPTRISPDRMGVTNIASHVERHAVDGVEGSEAPDEIAHFDHDAVIVLLVRLTELRDRNRPVFDCLPQQHHEGIFEPRRHRLDFSVLKRTAKPVTASAGRTHDAHLPGFGHGVDHVGILQEPRLESACGLPRRRFRHEGALARDAGDCCRRALREHAA
jgi:hypothetical protein